MLDAMKTLNGAASRAALAVGVRCATDITGFGLLGHMSHIARASKVTLRVDLDAIPVFAGVREAVRAGVDYRRREEKRGVSERVSFAGRREPTKTAQFSTIRRHRAGFWFALAGPERLTIFHALLDR